MLQQDCYLSKIIRYEPICPQHVYYAVKLGSSAFHAVVYDQGNTYSLAQRMTYTSHLSPKFKDFWCYLIQAILDNRVWVKNGLKDLVSSQQLLHILLMVMCCIVAKIFSNIWLSVVNSSSITSAKFQGIFAPRVCVQHLLQQTRTTTMLQHREI